VRRRGPTTWRPAAGAVALALGLVACGTTSSSAPPTATAPAHGGTAEAPVALRVEVLERRPHDPEAFTQGLELDGDVLYEGTGLYGESTLREVDPATGEVVRQIALDPEHFGEGITLVGDRLLQLTWKEGVALAYDPDTFEQVGSHRYEGQGWGLCLDGDRLVMSDGSARLTFRDPDTFEATGGVDVTLGGQPLAALNELECVGGHVYANVYQTPRIVEIDPSTGAVVATIDASGLLSPEEATDANVLNGITYDAAAGTFLITGKLWPALFEVTLVPA
jgi:glutamine cyclotransferase